MSTPTIETCEDCRKTIPCRCEGSHYDLDHSHYGMGAVRCGPCREAFRAVLQAESMRKLAAQRAAYVAHVAHFREHDECPDDGVICEHCCQHEDVDHGICNDCEENVMGDMIDAAMSIYEGDR